MTTNEERQAKALEGIFIQLMSIVTELRKRNSDPVDTNKSSMIKLPVNFVRMASGLPALQELDDEHTIIDEGMFAELFIETTQAIKPPAMVEPSERAKILQILVGSNHPFIVIEETVETLTENTKFRGFGVYNNNRFDVVGTVKGLVIPEEWEKETGE
jgi:hypothetical protein